MTIPPRERELRLTHVASCTSTQQLARELLEQQPQLVHVVRADAQTAGVGRSGRSWETPPDAALLLSIAVRSAGATPVLDGLVRRVVEELAARLRAAFALDPAAIVHQPPNDLVARADGAKVAGIMVDARSVGAHVDELVIGVGVNLAGPAWTTRADTRDVTTLEAVAGRVLPVDAPTLDALALALTRDLLELLA